MRQWTGRFGCGAACGRGCGVRGAKTASAAADAGGAERSGQLSHTDGAGDRGCADGRLWRHRDGADGRRQPSCDAVAGGRGFDPHQCALGRPGGDAAVRAGDAGTDGIECGGTAGQPADVHPHEPAQLYAVRPGAVGGGIRDGEPVSERAPIRGQAGGERRGAVCDSG